MSIKNDYQVKSIPKQQTYDWLLNKHYAKRIPSISYSFGLFSKELIGVCTFGTPPIQMNDGHCIFNSGDLRTINTNKEFKVPTIELNRLVVNEHIEKNVLSYFVAQCLELLPKPMCIVSYADPTHGHTGYIYQATNWIYTGQAELGGKSMHYIMNGRDYHGKTVNKEWLKRMHINFNESKTIEQNWIDNGGQIKKQKQKHRYLMFLGDKKQKKEMLAHLKYEILPYPKGNNQRYDASYQPTIQKELF